MHNRETIINPKIQGIIKKSLADNTLVFVCRHPKTNKETVCYISHHDFIVKLLEEAYMTTSDDSSRNADISKSPANRVIIKLNIDHPIMILSYECGRIYRHTHPDYLNLEKEFVDFEINEEISVSLDDESIALHIDGDNIHLDYV